MQDTAPDTDGPRLLETILWELADGVIVADLESRFLFCNPAAKQMMGISAHEALSDEWTATCGCYLRDKTTPYPADQLPLARAIRGETIEDELMFVRNRLSPSGLWLSVCGKPLRNRHGSLWGGMALFRDITEQETARRRIPVFDRLWTVLELTTDSVLITDRNGIIEYVNPAFETTSGYSRKEALGKTPRILKSGEHDEEFYGGLWKTVRAGQPFRATVVNRKKSGDLYSCEQTITPMKNSANEITHYVSLHKDITELLQKVDQEAQMRLARIVQQRFLRPTETLPGFDVAGAAYPADETGGDYFDFIDLPDGRLGVAIGDVSGHGIGAALIMAATRAYVRAFAATCTDPAQILTQVNRALVRDLEIGSFVTFLLCLVDSQKGIVSYSGAGHVPGHLFDASGEVLATLDSSGPPLGVVGSTIYASNQLDFSAPGQLLLLTTDGVMESESPAGTPFGLEGIIRHVGANRREPAEKIVESLYTAAQHHARNQPLLDDNTIVVIKAE